MEFQGFPGILIGLVLFAFMLAIPFGISGMFIACMILPGPFLFNRARRNQTWEQAARQLDGEFQPGGLFRLPLITFKHRGHFVTLDTRAIKTKFTKCYPRLTFTWPDHALAFQVRDLGALSAVTRALRGPGISIGDAEFQSGLFVYGNDPEVISRLFSPEVKTELNALRSLRFKDVWIITLKGTQAGPLDLKIDLSGGHLELMKRGLLNSEEDLQSFLRAGLRLYDALRTSQELATASKHHA